MSDPHYPSGYVGYGAYSGYYGGSQGNGYPSYYSFSYGNPGYRGHVVLIACAIPPPAITSASTATGIRGAAFTFSVTGSNSPAAFGITSGSLPYGYTLNTATGVISGTTQMTGAFPVTISASNASGTGAATFTLTVNPPIPTLTSAATATGTSGVEFIYAITASEAAAFSLSGTLPTGLSLNSTTGLITGTPTQFGTFNLTMRATNVTGTGTSALVLSINPPVPSITSGLVATASRNRFQLCHHSL